MAIRNGLHIPIGHIKKKSYESTKCSDFKRGTLKCQDFFISMYSTWGHAKYTTMKIMPQMGV